jgi:hypothetical protein
MKITFEENQSEILFRLSDFDPAYVPLFEMCFYLADKGDYIKRFPANTPDLHKIMKVYEKHAEEMFSQLGYFSPIPWEDALHAFLERVAGEPIDWWLTGSCAACIRGIALNPHDVDIMLNSRDLPIIQERFADVTIEPILDTHGWLTKEFGVLFLHARIDIATDPVASLDNPEPVDCGPYAKAHLEEVEWRGFPIKVPPVALQIAVNKMRGRYDRVTLLEAYQQQANTWMR